MSFLVSVVYLSFNRLLKNSGFSAEGVFLVLSNQKCRVFDVCVLPKALTKKMSEIYKELQLKFPTSIPTCGNN